MFIHELEKYFNCRFFVNDLLKTVTVKGANDILSSVETIPFTAGTADMTVLIADRITGASFTMKGDDGDAGFQMAIQWEQENVIEWTGSVQTMFELTNPPISNIVMIGDVWNIVDEDRFVKAVIHTGGSIAWETLQQPILVSTMFNYKEQSSTVLKIETAFSPLAQTLDWEFPFCENLKTEWKKITPRLIFVTFPGDVIKAHSRNANLDLNFNGPVGIFNLFYKQWINWIMNDRTNVQFSRQMSFLDIRDLDFTKKYEIKGNKFLLSEVAVTFSKDTIKPAIIKAFSCL